MKISVLHETKSAAAGGGNNFLIRFKNEIAQRGLLCETPESADLVLINSFPFQQKRHVVGKLLELKRNTNVKVCHRVDGPISLVRGDQSSLHVDQNLLSINELFADSTIFQSGFSRQACIDYGFSKNKLSTVIVNGAGSPRTRQITLPSNDRKLRFLTTSWSSNWKKGFDVLQHLDNALDFDRFDFTFIGNAPCVFQNINALPPVPSEQLLKLLDNFDVFVAPSVDEPCSNALIEAITAGLYPIARKSGGNPEIVGDTECLFLGKHDLLSKMEQLIAAPREYAVRIPSIQEAVDQYLAFFEETLSQSAVKPRVRRRDLQRAEAAFQSARIKNKIFGPHLSKRQLQRVKKGAPSQDLAGLSEKIETVFDRLPIYLHGNMGAEGTPKYGVRGDRWTRNLVPAVFAAKLFYMLRSENEVRDKSLSDAILSFKSDRGLIFDTKLVASRRSTKSILAHARKLKFSANTDKIVHAETRQSLAALQCLGYPLHDFAEAAHQNFQQLERLLEHSSWVDPWDTGAQFSHMCFFGKMSEDYGLLTPGTLEQKIHDILNANLRDDGFWYAGSCAQQQKINGAMKVLTGLRAASSSYSYDKEKLREACVQTVAGGHACNKFNLSFVLANAQTGHSDQAEINAFAIRYCNEVMRHYWPTQSAFSFFPDNANRYFYDRYINKGGRYPDIHGTMMMCWSLLQIAKITKLDKLDYLREPVT